MVKMSNFSVSKRTGQILGKLYDDNFKHGSYQMPPNYLLPYISAPKLNYFWRDTRPRLSILAENLQTETTAPIIELGANSGFQTLFLARSFPARKIIAVEGNKHHAKFIEICAEIEGLNNIQVLAEYATPLELLPHSPLSTFLDFNVVHHLGVDFANDKIDSVDKWWSQGIVEWLSAVKSFPEYWFSSGFMWGGNKNYPLHDPNDPSGFYQRILKQSGLCIETDPRFWTFTRDNSSSDIPISAKLTSIEKINHFTNDAVYRKDYVGEYFRRPLLQIQNFNL